MYSTVPERVNVRFDESSFVKHCHQLGELFKLKTQTSSEVVVFETIGIERCFIIKCRVRDYTYTGFLASWSMIIVNFGS